jgi:ABC-type lipoprotein export system ATPase subunit
MTIPGLRGDAEQAFVRISHLCKSYTQGALTTHVLSDVSTQFERGSFSAIVGRMGAMKYSG